MKYFQHNWLMIIFSALKTVINNAGIMVFGEFEWQTEDQIRNQIMVNLIGAMNITRTFLPFIRRNKGIVVDHSVEIVQVAFNLAKCITFRAPYKYMQSLFVGSSSWIICLCCLQSWSFGMDNCVTR